MFIPEMMFAVATLPCWFNSGQPAQSENSIEIKQQSMPEI